MKNIYENLYIAIDKVSKTLPNKRTDKRQFKHWHSIVLKGVRKDMKAGGYNPMHAEAFASIATSVKRAKNNPSKYIKRKTK